MFKKYINKTERLIRRFRVPRCDVPFVVVFRERTGSSHLCSILGNHHQVNCRQEDFHELVCGSDSIENPDSVLLGNIAYTRGLADFGRGVITNPGQRRTIAHLHDVFSSPLKAAGFKFKFRLQTRLFPEITSELKEHVPNLRLISLTRRNVLKQSISRQNMLRIKKSNGGKYSNLWKHLDSGEIALPFRLEISSAIEYANQLNREEAEFFEWIEPFRNKSRVLDIAYEDLLADQSSVIRQAFEFLQVDPDATVFSTVAKATPDNLAETISNLDELKDAIRGTDLEAFLD